MATTTRSTASKKRKDGVRNSTGSDEFAISNIEITIKSLRCSVCNRIPDKQIFNCPRGHLHCDICKQRNCTCLLADCAEVLTRSAVSESLLDEITFKCPWTNLGCEEASIRRSQLTARKKSCKNK